MERGRRDQPLGKESCSQGRGVQAAVWERSHVWDLQDELFPWVDVQLLVLVGVVGPTTMLEVTDGLPQLSCPRNCAYCSGQS